MSDTVYLGNPNLKKANVKVEFTQENIEEFIKCKDNPVYFAKNYIKIVSLDEGLVNFDLYPFQEKLIKNKLINISGDVLDLNSIERGSSGRVTKLEIQTDKVNKSIVLVKDDIRRVLNFIPSNLFTINKLSDDLWLLRGGGFGHGVGLSQSGAIEMAKLGFSYEQILNHYYRNAKLKKFEILSQ